MTIYGVQQYVVNDIPQIRRSSNARRQYVLKKLIYGIQLYVVNDIPQIQRTKRTVNMFFKKNVFTTLQPPTHAHTHADPTTHTHTHQLITNKSQLIGVLMVYCTWPS